MTPASDVGSIEAPTTPIDTARTGTTHRFGRFVERRAVLLAAVLIAAVCAVQVLLGIVPTRIYAQDLFIFMDGAWRLASGQLPQQDFYAGFGVLLWRPLQLAFTLTGFDASGMGIARALFTGVVGVWTLLLLRRRVPGWVLLVATAASLVLTSAARPIGEHADLLSNAMFYNRIGFAVVFIILLDTMFLAGLWPAFTRTPVGDGLWRGVSTGAAVVALALLKVSFVIPAVLIAAAGLLIWRTSRRHLLGIAAGGVGVALAGLALGWRPVPWIVEMARLSRARSTSVLDSVALVVADDGLLLAFVLALCFGLLAVVVAPRPLVLRYLASTLVVVGADVYARATNMQRGDLPLTAVWALVGAILLVGYATSVRPPRARAIAAIGAALAVLVPVAVPYFARDARSTMLAARTVVLGEADSPRIDAPRLAGFDTAFWTGSKTENGALYVAIIDDGLALAERYSDPDESIGSLGFSNPFSVALGRPAAHGGAPWLHPDNNFPKDGPIDAEVLVGEPEVLLVPAYREIASDGDAHRFDEVLDDYDLVGSSPYWTIYRHDPR
ncbi:hypothetical protein [Agromyces seonyuensis]|uniref:Glycosyltransferase RgtA/B/C/D-like domain-containing protein n=1 Tax=Agromyces seonyuensis TaxID=2662446 RepID=A0A6I4P1X4_9MICO|nr:hypothetical protein [Agromyces seonyuensis]MWC00412.1 hypothetical protein [Agromyces seonyuensis]